jgi:nicotinic acid mononucleotide adenylyltransferase
MARLAAGEREWLEVSDIEFAREGKTYSFDTVTELKRRNPRESF